MNRVTRFSSAAFGMLLLAGLAYYQGHEDPASGNKGALVGTVLDKKHKQLEIDCDRPEALDDQEREYCESKNPPGQAN